MAATRKIEITEETNQNWMDRTIEQLAPYRRAILGLVLALLVGIVAYALISRQSEQKLARSWDNYFSISEITPANEEAVRKVITELGTTEPAQLLKLKFSQYLMREGTQQLFSDKDAGKKKLNEAKTGFESIATASKNSLTVEESMLGAAVCEAALGNQKEAIAAYEKQLKQFPQGLFAKVASNNLERIKSTSANEWYDWFAKAEVNKATVNPFPDFSRPGSGMPGGNIPGSNIPGGASLPSLEGPGSLLPSFDPLNPLGNSGVPSTTPGLPSFTIPDPNSSAPATTEATTTPEKSSTEPAAPADDKSAPATTPEKSATPEPAKSEPAKTEPAKDAPATKEAEPAAKK